MLIVCATNASHPVRSIEFAAACRELNAVGVMLDLPDGLDRHVPDLAVELDRIIAAQAHPEKIICVLTHPPHGNELRHLQHIDCYRNVGNWARRRGLPFGVFSERQLPYLRAIGLLHRGATVEAYQVRKSCAPWLLREAYWISRQPKSLADRIRTITGEKFDDAVVSVRIEVNVIHKVNLCENYASQFVGLLTYRALRAQREYLYFNDPDAARAILDAIGS